MKKKSLLQRVCALIRVACKYALQHRESTMALDRVFTRQWHGDSILQGHTRITLRFVRYGSIYRVIQQYYLKEVLQRENIWNATYGWHSNGHLMEIGGYRYCIFNPERGLMYLEYYDDNAGEKKVEIYNEVKNA